MARRWRKSLLSGWLLTLLVIGAVLLPQLALASTSSFPWPWADADVGVVGTAGSASLSSGAFTNSGGGAGISGTADSFNYLYQPLVGSGQVVARITGAGTVSTGEAGLMIRSDLGASAQETYIGLLASTGVVFASRSVTGGSTAQTGGPAFSTPYWLRMSRRQNVFSGAISPDGVTWSDVGTASISMPTNVLIGIAVTSGQAGTLSTATGDNVRVAYTTSVSVNWATLKGITSPLSFGLNGHVAYVPSIATNSTFASSIGYAEPGFMRLRLDVDSVPNATNGWTWVNPTTQTWDPNLIAQTLDGIASWQAANGYAPSLMLNVRGFPLWMKRYSVIDPNNNNYVVSTGLLDPTEFTNFANFCAQLVQIVNVQQKRGIKFFELFNELDVIYYLNMYFYDQTHTPGVPDELDQLISVYNQAAQAMKAVDPSIQVGGPAFERVEIGDMVPRFVAGTAVDTSPTTIDFVTYHMYVTNSPAITDANLYNTVATRFVNGVQYVVNTTAQNSGGRYIPTYLDEFNIGYSPGDHDPRMSNNKGAVFDCLVYLAILNNGGAGGLAWDDSDDVPGVIGYHGKVDPNWNLLAGAYNLHLLNAFMVGTRAAAYSANTSFIRVLAVKQDPTTKSLLIVNQSPYQQQLLVNFNGWVPSSTTFTSYQISGQGFSAGTLNVSVVGAGNFIVPPNSVTVLTINSTT